MTARFTLSRSSEGEDCRLVTGRVARGRSQTGGDGLHAGNPRQGQPIPTLVNAVDLRSRLLSDRLILPVIKVVPDVVSGVSVGAVATLRKTSSGMGISNISFDALSWMGASAGLATHGDRAR